MPVTSASSGMELMYSIMRACFSLTSTPASLPGEEKEIPGISKTGEQFSRLGTRLPSSHLAKGHAGQARILRRPACYSAMLLIRIVLQDSSSLFRQVFHMSNLHSAMKVIKLLFEYILPCLSPGY